MLSHLPEEVTVQNSKGSLTAEMGRLPWGDHMVLLDGKLEQARGKTDDVLVPAGSFWRRNIDLQNRTKGRSTHAHCYDIYVLELAGLHTQLFEYADALRMKWLQGAQRDYSLYLLNYGLAPEEVRHERFETHVGLAAMLAKVRDTDKVAAHEMMCAAFQLVDSTGRVNPVAKAMQSGGAVGRFKTRRERALAVLDFERGRTGFVSDVIDDHMFFFEQLWQALAMKQTSESVADVGERVFNEDLYLKLGTPGNLLSPHLGLQGLQAVSRILGLKLQVLETIQAAPFRKVAAHLKRELSEAQRMCQENRRDDLLKLLRRSRRGLRWVFALHELREQVIRPYSLLLDDIKARRRTESFGKGTAESEGRPILRSDDPDVFRQVEEKLADVRAKIESKCNEEDLEHPIKLRVRIYLDTAQQALADDDWKVARANMEKAARLM